MSSQSKRFKLYKSGKQWVTAVIASIAIFAGIQMTSAQADTTDNNSINTTQLVDNNNKSTKNSTVDNQSQALSSQGKDTNADGDQNQTTVDTSHFVNGINNVNNNTYYYDSNNHQLFNEGWKQDNNKWYYFNQNGVAQTGWFKSAAGAWYYFNQDGTAQTGLYQSKAGAWYYFNQVNAWAETGWQQVNGHWYHFDPTNAWADTSWYWSGYAWYYFNPTNAWAETGWQRINGHWYYFDPTNAWMLTGTQTINGKAYTFNENGAWADEWAWPFPQDGEGSFSGAQLFGVHPGGEFRMNGFHDGLDFGSYDHPGSEVHAIHGGTVKIVGYTAGLDWYCVVDTGEYLVVYQEAFASRNNIYVQEGQHINTGDVIGVRNTSHVHIGITRQHNFNVALANSFNNNGTWLDPLQIIKNGMA